MIFVGYNLQSGFDIVIHHKKDGVVTPYYPFSKTTNVFNKDGKDVDTLLAEKADIEHAVPDVESPDNLRYLGNDNKWRTLPDASSTQKGVVTVSDTLDVEETASYMVPNIEIVKSLNKKIEEIDGGLNNYIPVTEKGKANGVATLDEYGLIPSSQLPSFVDDIIEGYISEDHKKFYRDEDQTQAIVLEAGKIYVDVPTNKTYRFSGSQLIEISESLALGETSSTAFRGDLGKIAYDHSQATHARIDATKTSKSELNGYVKVNDEDVLVYTHPIKDGFNERNPHGLLKDDIDLGNVENISGEALVNKYVTQNLIVEKLGFTPASTDLATQDKAGLMSASDKTKLDTMMRTVVGSENTSNNVLWLKTLPDTLKK